MTAVEQQVRVARRRLWANRWFGLSCWLLTAAAGAMAAVVLFDRLYGLAWPLGPIALTLAGLALVVSTVWSIATRLSPSAAAAALDEAAGLRERISSGLYCAVGDEFQGDPFAEAVVTDAERISNNLSVRQHLRLRAPFPLVYASLASVVAALLLLLPSGLLLAEAQQRDEQQTAEVNRVKVVAQRKLDEVKKLVEATPAIKELKEDLDLDREAAGKLERPDQVRHEAIRKIDRLADALREQRKNDRFNAVDEAKKMMRNVQPPGEAKSPAEKLAKSLAEGNFKAANEQIKALQEQLAKMETPENADQLKDMKQQLESLAKKLSAAADDKKLKQQLEQAGVKKEDIERMLQNLSKKDLDQLRQQLQQQGMKQQDIDKLTQQMQKRQQACSMCKQMSQSLQQAADAAGAGQSGQAMSDLQAAGDQLSEMETLEQEMNQIDSMMADLQDAKNDLDNPCPSCGGSGCQQCGGKGNQQPRGGMGQKPGQGRGNVAPEQQTATGFKRHRAKVQTTQGRIIGQFLVNGQQIKGDVAQDLGETIAAEETVATDLIQRDRIPRIHQKAVKEYFSSIRRPLDRAGGAAGEKDGASAVTGPEPADATPAETDSGGEEDSSPS